MQDIKSSRKKTSRGLQEGRRFFFPSVVDGSAPQCWRQEKKPTKFHILMENKHLTWSVEESFYKLRKQPSTILSQRPQTPPPPLLRYGSLPETEPAAHWELFRFREPRSGWSEEVREAKKDGGGGGVIRSHQLEAGASLLLTVLPHV